MLLCACGANGGNISDTTTAQSGVDTSASPETESTPELVTIIENGETEYVLLRYQDVDAAQQNLFTQFFQQLIKLTGCNIKYTEALEKAEIDAQAKEFLLGNTNRPESIELRQKLTDAGGNRFGISMKGT